MRSFGTDGRVKVESLSHSKERFRELRTVYIGADEEHTTEHVVTRAEVTHNGVLIMLAGIEDKTSADRLAGKYIFIDEQNLVAPPDGSYFIHDIVGCTLWMKGVSMGTIVEVIPSSHGIAQDMWVVETTQGKKWFPAIRKFIEEVDLGERKITASGPDGLFED